MQTSTEARIADWEPRSAADGYAGLNALAESGFSGVITGSETALFMLKGRTVGLADGSIEQFETDPLTARTAPHPALPLLFSMRERGSETRASYYTNDTPIEEVTATLEDGGFTGYIELSENVLSGDYFLVYHQGRSMCVAFVGSDDRLVTDDEAESRLREEVGIYTVEAVDVTEITIPEPTTGPSQPIESTEDTEPTGDSETATRSSKTKEEPPETGDETAVEPESEIPTESNDEPPNETIEAPTEPAEAPSETVETPSEIVEATTEAVEPSTSDSITSDSDSEPASSEPSSSDSSPSDPSTPNSSPSDRSSPDRSDEPTEPHDRWGSVIENPVEDRIAAEQQWQETNRIPSLDPERSMVATKPPETAPANTTDETTPEPTEEVLSRALDALESEREAREAAEESITQLREEIEQLEARLAATEEDSASNPEAASLSETDAKSPSGTDPEPTPSQSLDPETALSGTNLFVRYASKGAATLETAHAGEADRERLAENLRLERRTEFDAATVEGTPFETFLADRLEYRFAEWIVGELPFELAETGHASSLGALYDALPAIDRIELRGTVEEDEEGRSFDVVCRDRMGAPLFVVDCANGRKATTAERVAGLVESATEVKDATPDLAGAMIVTTSYFDPGALSTAAEATRSGLLGGGSRESFVTISRRNGYHLCLVEMHDGTFHVTVPEL